MRPRRKGRGNLPPPSLRRALRASDLRPTPAELLEAWRRIREATR